MISSIPLPTQVSTPVRTIAPSNPSPSTRPSPVSTLPISLNQEPDHIPAVPGAMLLTDLENPRQATHRHLVTLIHATTEEGTLVDLLTCGDGFSQIVNLIRSEFTRDWVVFEILPIDHLCL